MKVADPKRMNGIEGFRMDVWKNRIELLKESKKVKKKWHNTQNKQTDKQGRAEGKPYDDRWRRCSWKLRRSKFEKRSASYDVSLPLWKKHSMQPLCVLCRQHTRKGGESLFFFPIAHTHTGRETAGETVQKKERNEKITNGQIPRHCNICQIKYLEI